MAVTGMDTLILFPYRPPPAKKAVKGRLGISMENRQEAVR